MNFRDQLLDLFRRVTVIEQDIKRHEHIALTIAWIVTAFLTLLSIFTVPLIIRWLRGYLRSLVAKELQPHIAEAQESVKITRHDFDEQLSNIRASRDEAKIYLQVLKERAREGAAQGGPALEYDIQFGEREVTFDNTNYLAMDQLFEREFDTVPQVFVGEGRPGAWLVVKVDQKGTRGFRWAANNLLGPMKYPTVIQWLAIAKAPKRTEAAETAPRRVDPPPATPASEPAQKATT